MKSKSNVLSALQGIPLKMWKWWVLEKRKWGWWDFWVRSLVGWVMEVMKRGWIRWQNEKSLTAPPHTSSSTCGPAQGMHSVNGWPKAHAMACAKPRSARLPTPLYFWKQLLCKRFSFKISAFLSVSKRERGGEICWGVQPAFTIQWPHTY